MTTFSEGITDLSNAQAHEDREDRFVGVTQETQIYRWRTRLRTTATFFDIKVIRRVRQVVEGA